MRGDYRRLAHERDTRMPKLVKREVRRRRFQYAWISIDGSRIQHECRLANLSHGGAQIIIEHGIILPERFAIALVPDTPHRKSCEVVWRRGQTVGIKFTG